MPRNNTTTRNRRRRYIEQVCGPSIPFPRRVNVDDSATQCMASRGWRRHDAQQMRATSVPTCPTDCRQHSPNSADTSRSAPASSLSEDERDSVLASPLLSAPHARPRDRLDDLIEEAKRQGPFVWADEEDELECSVYAPVILHECQQQDAVFEEDISLCERAQDVTTAADWPAANLQPRACGDCPHVGVNDLDVSDVDGKKYDAGDME